MSKANQAEIQRFRKKSILEKALPHLGFVERLSEEKPYAADICWAGQLGKGLFRLGDRGKFLYDPKNDLAQYSPNDSQLEDFIEASKKYVDGDNLSFKELLSEGQSIFARGIIRRIINSRTSNREFKRAIKNEDRGKLSQLFAIIQREADLSLNEKESDLPGVLIVAHTRFPEISMMFDGGAQADDESHGLGTLKRAAIDMPAVIHHAMVASTVPHLATAIIAQELQKTGKIGKIKVVDYHDVVDGSWEEKVKSFDFKQVMMSGATSFDIETLAITSKKLKDAGKNILIGGLLADLDPVILEKTTSADIYSGEIEGAGNQLVDLLLRKKDEKRLLIHRGKAALNDKLNMENSQLEQVYLGLNQYVDIAAEYSYENESNGQLADRFRWLNKFTHSAELFGKEWDQSDILRFHQLEIERGCPHGCKMCSTSKVHGNRIRRKPVEALELEVLATESWGLVALDQNMGSRGINEKPEFWNRWMKDFFSMLLVNKKKLFMQTELDLFKRLEDNPEVKGLVKQTLAAFLSGIEHPAPVTGSALKSPEHQKDMMSFARKYPAMMIGSAVLGLEGSMAQGHKAPSKQDWLNMLSELRPDVLLAFPFLRIPGVPGVESTRVDAEDPLMVYRKKYRDEDLEAVLDLSKDYYSFSKIVMRLWNMEGKSKEKVGLFLILNAFMGIQLAKYKYGYFETAVKDR